MNTKAGWAIVFGFCLVLGPGLTHDVAAIGDWSPWVEINPAHQSLVVHVRCIGEVAYEFQIQNLELYAKSATSPQGHTLGFDLLIDGAKHDHLLLKPGETSPVTRLPAKGFCGVTPIDIEVAKVESEYDALRRKIIIAQEGVEKHFDHYKELVNARKFFESSMSLHYEEITEGDLTVGRTNFRGPKWARMLRSVADLGGIVSGLASALLVAYEAEQAGKGWKPIKEAKSEKEQLEATYHQLRERMLKEHDRFYCEEIWPHDRVLFSIVHDVVPGSTTLSDWEKDKLMLTATKYRYYPLPPIGINSQYQANKNRCMN